VACGPIRAATTPYHALCVHGIGAAYIVCAAALACFAAAAAGRPAAVAAAAFLVLPPAMLALAILEWRRAPSRIEDFGRKTAATHRFEALD